MDIVQMGRGVKIQKIMFLENVLKNLQGQPSTPWGSLAPPGEAWRLYKLLIVVGKRCN
jgi:hypothetical protein